MSNWEQGVSARSIILGHGARLPKISGITGEFQVQESIHPRPAFHIVVKDDKKPKVFEAIITADPTVKYIHDVTRFSSLRNENKLHKKVFVFALHPHIVNHGMLEKELFDKLQDLKLISQNAQLVKSMFSDVILPALSDDNLYALKDNFGSMVNILRTESFAIAIGYYAERWKSKI